MADREAEASEKIGAGGRIVEEIMKSDASGVLGRVIWLLTQSLPHRRWEIGTIDDLILEPIRQKQFKLYVKEHVPQAFVTWAMMSGESEEHFLETLSPLRKKDWTSGDNLWVMDIIAPFGGHEAVIHDLFDTIFAERKGKMLRPLEDGSGIEVVAWEGFKLGATDPKKVVGPQHLRQTKLAEDLAASQKGANGEP